MIFIDALDKTSLRISNVLRHVVRLTVSEPVMDMFGSLLNSFLMDGHVFGSRYYNQVLSSVVALKPVKMMNDLIFSQNPAQLLFHNQPVLKNVTLNSRIRVVGSKHIHISPDSNLATSPLGVAFSGLGVTVPRTVLASPVFKVRWWKKKIFTALSTDHSYRWVSIFTLLNHKLNYRLGNI